MDFLVSDLQRYRALRATLQSKEVLKSFFGIGRGPLEGLPMLRSDQYGIRTRLGLMSASIKFEIVFEARIEFDPPGPQDHIAGIATLTETDLVASKLLANVDRWADPSVMHRDIIDLAMLQPSGKVWTSALQKAESAYGPAVPKALNAARTNLLESPGRLARSIKALKITTPPALIHQNLKNLPPYP